MKNLSDEIAKKVIEFANEQGGEVEIAPIARRQDDFINTRLAHQPYRDNDLRKWSYRSLPASGNRN
ncbi:MAG: hypothetical protein LBU73_09570 [Helicobacteraceae bacterium]|nr:hypothetical protein [Helicobacteraceae bacterium]